MRSEIYSSWAGKTSLLCKFPCSLNLPTTNLEWSSSFFSPSLPFVCRAQFANHHRAGESVHVQRQSQQEARRHSLRSCFLLWSLQVLTIQILILSDLARFLSADHQDFLVNKTFMHFLLVHDAFFWSCGCHFRVHSKSWCLVQDLLSEIVTLFYH